MTRLLNPFVLVLTGILAGAYVYLAWRLAPDLLPRLTLAVPFILVWLVPVVYWVGDRESGSRMDELLHVASYACMGWLNFALSE